MIMERAADSLYERDFHAWAREQAARLRAVAGLRVNADVDWETIAEELEGMGGSLRRELRNRLGELLLHLAKLAWSPDTYPRRKWRQSVINQRTVIAEVLAESPSLAPIPTESLAAAWDQARRMAEAVLALPEGRLPPACPWTLDAEILNADWFPPEPSDDRPAKASRRYGVRR